MSKVNRVCHSCGKEYYCCSSCVGDRSWHNFYCSPACYVKERNDNNLLDILKEKTIDKGETYMTIVNKSSRYIGIKGYDLAQMKFDGENGHTYILEEIKDFILDSKEMEAIINAAKSLAEPVVKEADKEPIKVQNNNFKNKKDFQPKQNKKEEE